MPTRSPTICAHLAMRSPEGPDLTRQSAPNTAACTSYCCHFYRSSRCTPALWQHFREISKMRPCRGERCKAMGARACRQARSGKHHGVQCPCASTRMSPHRGACGGIAGCLARARSSRRPANARRPPARRTARRTPTRLAAATGVLRLCRARQHIWRRGPKSPGNGPTTPKPWGRRSLPSGRAWHRSEQNQPKLQRLRRTSSRLHQRRGRARPNF